MLYKNSKEFEQVKFKKGSEMNLHQQMEAFLIEHVKYMYAMQKLVEAVKIDPLALKNYSDLKIYCPVCGNKSLVSNLLNIDKFQCTNPVCGFELSAENIMKEAEKIKKGIQNNV